MTTIKNYCRLFCAFILILIASGCDNQQADPSEKEIQRFVLRLGHQGTSDSALHIGALRLSEKINRISKDTISLHIYPAGELGTDDTVLKMTQNGELDIALVSTSAISRIEPAFSLFDIPFLLRNETTAHKLIDGKVGNLLFSKLSSQNLVGLTIWESGFKHVTAKRQEDFLKKALDLLETDIVNQPTSELSLQASLPSVFRSLDQNAKQNTLHSLAISQDSNDEQLILSSHQYAGHAVLLSKSSFNAFPLKIQQWITQAALSVTQEQRQHAATRNKKALEQLTLSGIAVESNFSASQIAKQNTLAQVFVEKYRNKIGSSIIEHFLQQVDFFEANVSSNWIIGLDADLTSHSSKSGLSIKRGIEIAIDEINQSGGWLGQPVKLIARDNAMMPSKGLENIKYFSSIDNLVAVFGGISSPVTLAEIPLIHKNKILFLNPWAAATNIVENGYEPNYVFRLSVRDEYAAPFLLGEAFKQSTAVGLLLVNNPWGRSNFKALSNIFNQKNRQPTHIEWFNWGESNMQSKVQRLKEMGSETIIYVGNPVEAVKMVQANAKLDKPMRVISHWGITGGDFSKMAGDALNKIDLKVLQTFSFVDTTRPKALNFSKAYKNKYFVENIKGIVAPVGSAHAYDLMHLLAIAVNKAQSADPERLQKQLENLDNYSGLVKDYMQPFSENNHDALNVDSFMLATYKDGLLVPTKVQDEFDKN
jgi:TRAP-type C4-dicarboxylate transport system substrate-binding protein/ABC-type branched-subunit amino acid transport system substrate-binding protein